MEDTNRMPIYVYERPDGSRFEIRQGFNDSALIEDPETGVPVRRVLQPAPIIFKGSGWYKTDSRATSSNGTKSESESKTPEAAAPSADKGEKSEAPAASETPAAAAPGKGDVPTKPSAEAKKAADKIAASAAS
jgi:predicted nucleic acid-binding Zn ribbon protein